MTTPIVPAMKPTTSEREELIRLMYEDLPGQLSEMEHYPVWADAILAAGFRRDPGWIACSERMPPAGACLVYDAMPRQEHHRVRVARIVDAAGWAEAQRAFKNDTHWMPLPPAPEAREGTTT